LRLTAGLVTFVLGLALFVASWLERAAVPRWMPRLAGGVTSLGASTLALGRGGEGWTIASIALSAVAIALLVSVIVDNLWRGRRGGRGGRPR
jgi:hypothetical protein